MFKYIAYNYLTDTIIATNDYTYWYLGPGNTPQQCEYFHSLEEANEWCKKHPDAHQRYLNELKDEQRLMEECRGMNELIDAYSTIVNSKVNNFLEQTDFQLE